MGQDFRAMMSHELTVVVLPKLAERLDLVTEGLRDWVAQVRLDGVSDSLKGSQWRWGWSDLNEPDLERWHRGKSLSLFGPESMTIFLGQHCLTFGCWIRWVEFVRDKHTQEVMRQIVFTFARFFDSEMAIYLPDSSSREAEGAQNRVYEGARIDEILASLAQWQPPATTIDSICMTVKTPIDGRIYDTVECDGYYVDRFDDLSA